MTKQTTKLHLTRDTVRSLTESRGGAEQKWSTQPCISYSNCQSCWTE
jgi:hypothetical protein